jgi:rSAM/selenodomain-associated transferase 1
MDPPAVSLMLKAPRAGFVKTRLARSVGLDEATGIYRRLVEHQIAQIPAAWPAHIHFAPAECGDVMRTWLGADHLYSPQPDGDLGARLSAAMRAHFAVKTSPVMFLGGDCPSLTSARLEQAAGLLAAADAVLIPAMDGGYCLLALRRPDPHLFTSIPWSTPRVADETRHRLRERGFSWKELPALEDVDDDASWQRAREQFPDLAR